MQVLRTSRPRRLARFNPLVIQPARWRTKLKLTQGELPPRNSGKRRILSAVLLTGGGILCSYVIGSYTWMYAEQKRLLTEWKQQNASEVVTDGFTKISIPRIGLRAVVLEGTSSHSLLLGPAHMTGSAIPGMPGNSVIAGHRDTFFRHVHSLHVGDEIYISRAGTRFRYVVWRRRIVEPTDLSVLNPSADSELTLITCYPTHVIGPAPERLIVIAKLRDEIQIKQSSPSMLAIASK